MNSRIQISEINKACELSPMPTLLNELKITNVSSEFIKDLKLIIRDPHPILQQSVTRARGFLTFDPQTSCLELGNLAPDESAYFEYKFAAPNHLSSLTAHFSLVYTETSEDDNSKQKIVELLLEPTISLSPQEPDGSH